MVKRALTFWMIVENKNKKHQKNGADMYMGGSDKLVQLILSIVSQQNNIQFIIGLTTEK